MLNICLNMFKLTAYACQYSQWILCCFAVFWSSADTKMLISEYATAKATFAGRGKKKWSVEGLFMSNRFSSTY